jgi:hypothetical protein
MAQREPTLPPRRSSRIKKKWWTKSKQRILALGGGARIRLLAAAEHSNRGRETTGEIQSRATAVARSRDHGLRFSSNTEPNNRKLLNKSVFISIQDRSVLIMGKPNFLHTEKTEPNCRFKPNVHPCSLLSGHIAGNHLQTYNNAQQ